MTLTRLAWMRPYVGEDLHVLRDRWSPSLLDRVELVDHDGGRHEPNQAATPDLVDVRVTTNLRGQPTVDGTHAAHQVTLRPWNGQVYVSGPGGPEDPPVPRDTTVLEWSDAERDQMLPHLRVRNFILTVWASVVDGTATRELDPLQVRVHVHESIDEFWLTPSLVPLPRAFADGPAPDQFGVLPRRRARLLARFNTGITGDLTNEPDLAWSAADKPADAGASDWIGVDPNTGFLWATRTVPDAIYELEVRVPPRLALADSTDTARCEVRVQVSWDEVPADERTLVDLTNSYDPAEGLRPNDVLLIGDGIDASRQALFTKLLRNVAQKFRRAGRPVRGLFSDVRFFVHAPTSETAITISSAMVQPEVTSLQPPQALAEAVPTEDVDDWAFRHVASELDLADPITKLQWDEAAPSNDIPDPVDYAIARWRALYDLPADRWDRIETAAPISWLSMADRFQAEDGTTAIGVTRGDRAGFGRDPNRRLGLSPDHMTGEELHALVETLCLPDGSTPATPTEVGAHWTTGPGRRLLVVVAAGHNNGGTFSPSVGATFIALPGSSSPERFDDAVAAPRRAIERALWELEKYWESDFLATLQHELGHAFGLGDEYGGLKVPTAGNRTSALRSPNLDIGPKVGQDGLEETPDHLDGNLMRWSRLYRTADAWVADDSSTTTSVQWVLGGSAFHQEHGVPVEIPDPSGGSLDLGALAVRLQPGTITRAMARKRPLATPAEGAEPTVLFLRERILRGDSTSARVVGPFHLEQVLSIDDGALAGEWVVVRELQGSSTAVVGTQLGDTDVELPPVLFRPVPKAADLDGWARLVPVLVRDHVHATGRPLDVAPGDTLHVQRHDRAIPPMRNKPTALDAGKPWWPSRRVVGLWTGGAAYDQDIYHATAQSIMRASTIEMSPGKQGLYRADGQPMTPEEARAARDQAAHIRAGTTEESVIVNDFGPLNAWLLVEQIDPELHHGLEKTLARWDPDGSTP